MRSTVLAGLVVILAACSKADAPAPADTAATGAIPQTATTRGSFAGVWDVSVMPEGSDSVATTHVLNVSDTSAWVLEFSDRPSTPLRITGMSGDTVMAEAGPFESGVRRGVQVRTTNSYWLQDGKVMGRTTARYETAGSDTLRRFHSVGTKR